MKKIILLASLFIGMNCYAEDNCALMVSPNLINACLNLNTIVAQSQVNLVNTFAAGVQQNRSATNNNNTVNTARSVTTEKSAVYNQPTTTPNIQPTLKQPPSPTATTPNQLNRPKIHY